MLYILCVLKRSGTTTISKVGTGFQCQILQILACTFKPEIRVKGMLSPKTDNSKSLHFAN